ncbi:MAG TPA: DcaP family trimeric outer membrane transporter [Fimbriiglobus sp.]|jgi:hypothetical protein
MNRIIQSAWKHGVAAAVIGTGLSSTALAQQSPQLPDFQPVKQYPGQLPYQAVLPPAGYPAQTAIPGIPQPPPAFQPVNQYPGQVSYQAVPPTGYPAQTAVPGIPQPNPAFQPEMQPTRILTQAPAPTQPQPPIFSQQPPPFQVTPDTAAASNDPNFYPGNKPVQDLSSLLTGNFKSTKYKWYGFVRLDGTYDFKPMGGTDSFVTSQIPVPQGRGQNFAMNPRYTRFGFDTETPIESMDWTLKTRLEVDFFNGNDSGAFGSFPLRLRFAWADFGPFLIGQAASVFMDYDVFPNVLDYQGPPGMILMRQPIAAIHFPVGEKLQVSMGIEQPYSDIQWLENGAWVLNPGSGVITTPAVGKNVQDVPDVTSNVRYKGDYGHVQVAGILRKLTFQPAAGDSAYDDVGYGINVTGTFHPWAYFSGTSTSGDCATNLSKSRFLWQYAAGRGISRYYNDVNGLGLDATWDPANGLRTIPSEGWFLAYEHWWTNKWISNFTYSETQLDLTNTLPGNTYNRANYVTANLIWLPVERMGVGLEYLYGTRKDKDGEKGDNTRIQVGFQYRF